MPPASVPAAAAAAADPRAAVTLETPIVVKVQYENVTKRFKLQLKELGSLVLPEKLRTLLQIDQDETFVIERFSDSLNDYVTLDANKPQVYKTLFRAAKAKLKLRLRVTVPSRPTPPPETRAPKPFVRCGSLPPSELSKQGPLPPQVIAQFKAFGQKSPLIARSPHPPHILSMPASKPTMPESDHASPVSPLMSHKAENEAEGKASTPSFNPDEYFSQPNASTFPELTLRPKEPAVCTSWQVYCNNCEKPMDNEHFHCSICDDGDFDLCPGCVDSGIHCHSTGHWMVKRFMEDNRVVNSTTQRLPPKFKAEAEANKQMPGAYTEEKQPVHDDEEPTRTCNCCVKCLPEKEFVTCASCDDYDLCLECHVENKHGHHPGHAFKGAAADTSLTTLAEFLCNAGRNVRHSAVCDGCDKFIYGVRHKCLNCPDWDFCGECMKSAAYIHPRHRFVPIYEPLAEPVSGGNRHYGIYCDGPLCKDKEVLSYLEGVRYKCAVCHDTDFCANCEAHPDNRHNHTHPLIKFKTPVRNVSVTTLNEDKAGRSIARVGDRQPSPTHKSTATETSPSPQCNHAQVQTLFDVKPNEQVQPKTTKEKIAIRDLLSEPVQEECTVKNPPVDAAPPVAESHQAAKTETPKGTDKLDAHFIRDTICDGSEIVAGTQFVQIWTLRNPGPNPWPAGCSVRHTGGDNMLNVDNTRPLSQTELADASETNVVGRPVESGEEISFRVAMKAPARLGTSISYWRIKTPDGMPFGHRLWCDIQVVEPPSPKPALSILPTPTLSAGEVSESSKSAELPDTTKYDATTQAKLEKLKALRLARLQLHGRRMENDMAIQWDNLDKIRKGSFQTPEEKNAEQERMLRIQKFRQAAIERLLENRRNQAGAARDQFIQATEVPVKQETAELPVEDKPIERPSKSQASGMIFPQLEKESPESSMHESPTTAPESPKTAAGNSDEYFEDAETVDIRSISSDDEGFLTDEEYDILDASDEEMP